MGYNKFKDDSEYLYLLNKIMRLIKNNNLVNKPAILILLIVFSPDAFSQGWIETNTNENREYTILKMIALSH